MPEDGLFDIAGAAVVEEVGVAVHCLLQPDAPEGRGAPFVAAGQSAHIVVVQADAHDFAAHVVEEIVGIGVDGLVAEPGQFRAVEEGGTTGTRAEGGDVAEVALGLIEHPFAVLHLGVVHVAARWHTEGVEIEVDVLHVARGDIELVVA